MATKPGSSDAHQDIDQAPSSIEEGDAQSGGDSIPRRIVGIGASAGGLEALDTIFETMSLDSGCAFVVIQHLSRDFDSHMPSLLARKTRMPVKTAEHDMVVEANHIYLIPKGRMLSIEDGLLKVALLDRMAIPPMPISFFFRSLAKDQGANTIAIVLSGGGSDGTDGAVAVHHAGGRVIVQDPKSAQFESMPQSVINTGIFDLILRPEQIGEAILDYGREPAEGEVAPKEVEVPTATGRIIELLKDAYSVDFSVYKPATITRRIERRIQIDHISSMEAYAELLATSVEELDKLYEDLLIGVTQFFRDPLQFACLETKIIPELVKAGGARGEIRVWIAGCASGEEAYSIAILLDEAIHQTDVPIKVRIFATDVHGSSLHRAITGRYSEDAVVDISPERLSRYFMPDSEGYRVVPSIRETVLFTRHNLVQDPPFTNVDLVTCRNLLIYFDNEAQEKAIARLHFALREQGHLFLGTSERTGRYKDEFESIAPQVQIFRKKRDVRLAEAAEPIESRLPSALGERRRVQGEPPKGLPTALTRAYDFLLEKIVHRGFLIDGDANIHHTFGDAGRYTPLSGSMQTNLLALVDERLKSAVHTTLLRVQRSEGTEQSGFVRINIGNDEEKLRVEAQAMPMDHNGRRMYLLLFVPENTMPVDIDTPPATDGNEKAVDEVAWLRQELMIARQSLDSLMQEVGTRNEELQASNEELTAANEELQSTNEELQSVNEELFTVNDEYQKKIVELQATTDDLNNLIRSTEIGVIFTDRDLNIRRFTPKATEFLRLIETDIGRPLNDVSPRLPVSNLPELVRGTAMEGKIHEEEVKTENGHWYLMRILPYRGKGKIIEGAVLAFIDIHLQKSAERNARIAEKRYDLAIKRSGLGIWDWDVQTGELFWSDEFKGILKIDPYKFDGKVADFERRVHPEDVERVERAVTAHLKNREAYDIEFRMVRDDGTSVLIHARGAAIRNDEGVALRSVGFVDDVSERQRQERALRYEHTPVMIHSINTEGRLIDVNPLWLQRMGYERDEVIGRKSTEFLTEESLKRATEYALPKFFKTGRIDNVPYQFVTKSGELLDVLMSASSIRDDEGKIIASVATLVDTTNLKESQFAQLDLLESVKDLPIAIAIFGADNRLVRWNQAYVKFYEVMQDKIVADATFADLLQASAESGIFAEDITAEEIDKRLSGPSWTTERTLTAGGKVRILDYRMVDGSLAAFRYKIDA